VEDGRPQCRRWHESLINHREKLLLIITEKMVYTWTRHPTRASPSGSAPQHQPHRWHLKQSNFPPATIEETNEWNRTAEIRRTRVNREDCDIRISQGRSTGVYPSEWPPTLPKERQYVAFCSCLSVCTPARNKTQVSASDLLYRKTNPA
jgi:hypothetical protein